MYVNIPRLRGVSKSLVLNARGKKLATRVTCGAETRKARKKTLNSPLPLASSPLQLSLS